MATKKQVNLSVGRGEKLSVKAGGGLTAKGRQCKLCLIDISHMRADAKFCCRKHKGKFSDSKRDYAKEYQKNKEYRQKQSLYYYYLNHKLSKLKQLKRQKNNLSKIAAYEAKRRAEKLKRTPSWLTKDDLWIINQFYELAKLRTQQFGFFWHVDHIIPLQGKLVSGLHVPENMQVIPAFDNISKNNKYEIL